MLAYFAYGSNLDRAAMARRCPHAVPSSLGAITDYEFFIMASGFASVRDAPGAIVHGLLWTLADADLPALDEYEDVDGGLYRRTTVSIAAGPSRAIIRALVYVGESRTIGNARGGYMEAVIAAASDLGLPGTYLDELRRWLPS